MSTPTSNISPITLSQQSSSHQNAKHKDPDQSSRIFTFYQSSPDSPSQSNSNAAAQQKVDCSKTSQENYQEFFFSHLPIIEYQFKEFKEKTINYLHLHFSYSNISKHSSSHPANLKSVYQKNFNQQILIVSLNYYLLWLLNERILHAQ